MKISMLLLLATITNITSSKRTKRTVNADACDISKHPYVVSFTKMSNFDYGNVTKYRFGTGVIITTKWVLTTTNVIENNVSFSDWKVLAGRNYELPSETDKFRTIKRVVFDPKKEDFFHGPALIELKEPFETSDKAKPAKLPEKANFINGCKRLTVVGWGTRMVSADEEKEISIAKEADKLGDTLKCAKVGEIRKTCWNLEPQSFCFDMEGTTQMCANDFGFGVFCENILVGFTGSALIGTGVCQSNDAAAYNISESMDWLHKDTGIAIPPMFYQNVTGPDPRTENSRRKSITHDSTSDEENSEIFSKAHHISSIHYIYALLICLHLIL